MGDADAAFRGGTAVGCVRDATNIEEEALPAAFRGFLVFLPVIVKAERKSFVFTVDWSLTLERNLSVAQNVQSWIVTLFQKIAPPLFKKTLI